VQVGVGVGEGAITRLIVEVAEAVIFVPASALYPVAVKYRPSLDKVINPWPLAAPPASAKPTRAVKLNRADECNLFFAKVLNWRIFPSVLTARVSRPAVQCQFYLLSL